MKEHNPPKIVFWDLECSFNIMGIFALFEEPRHYKQILQEKYLICGAWKELGKDKVHAVSVLSDNERFKKDHNDDYVVVKALHDMLSGVDILVAHNGDRFDLPLFNSRAIFHGLPPLQPIRQIDTLKVAKHHFRFNSNRLDYLGQYLGLGAKLPTSPGLWVRAFKGERKAIREMVEYNKQDVLLLEQVYLKLRPYMFTHPKDVESSRKDLTCNKCYSNNIQKRGFHRTITGLFQRYQCTDCGGWTKGTRIVKG